MNTIICDNIRKRYGETSALAGVSFTAGENPIIGVIGRNGAGKTTLLRIIAGFSRQDAGEVRVFGKNPFNNLSVAGSLIFCDDHMLYPDAFSAEDIFSAAARFYRNFDAELARRLLDYFGIDVKRLFRRLSKGEKSIVNAVLAIAARCPLTIFDEPTTGMDAAVRRDFYRALLKDYLAFPRTVLLSSHLLDEIENLLEGIVLLHRGEKLLELPMTEFNNYAVSLRGAHPAMRKALEGREVIAFEEGPGDTACAVVRNTYSAGGTAELAGVSVSAVTAEELCVLLTAGKEGGIDRVFSET